MTVYWDAVAAFNMAIDYLLLLCTARLAGLAPRRRRLAGSAGIGALYAVAALYIPAARWFLLPVLALMGCVAYRKSGAAARLTLLFAVLSCTLAGMLTLCGTATGTLSRLAEGVLYAKLPWGVFLCSAALAYVLLAVIFRGGAAKTGKALVRAKIRVGKRSAEVTLLRDTGNTLCDPRTGQGVPVIDARALAGLWEACGTEELAYRSIGAEGTLRAFYCDALTVDGEPYGARLIALAEDSFPGTYAGLWCEEENEDAFVAENC